MSVLSMPLSPAPLHDCFSAGPLADAAAPRSSTGLLIAASRIQPGERVKVVGRDAASHVVGLARSGCSSATGVHPDALFFQREAADVVWLTGIDDVEARMTAALRNIGTPRVVAIELLASSEAARLSPFIRQLITKGLVACATHKTADSLIFVASRPAWLRKVIKGSVPLRIGA